MIDLVNLKNHHCRYMPVDGLFCGARSEVGKSWCADHSKLVYTASRPRGVQFNKPLPKLLQGVRK